MSVSISQNAPHSDNSQSTSNDQSSHVHQGATVDHSFEENPFAPTDEVPFVNVFAPEESENSNTNEDQNTTTSVHYPQPHEYLRKWTNEHPIDNIIGNPSRPVSTRRQLAPDALWCFFNSVLTKA